VLFHKPYHCKSNKTFGMEIWIDLQSTCLSCCCCCCCTVCQSAEDRCVYCSWNKNVSWPWQVYIYPFTDAFQPFWTRPLLPISVSPCTSRAWEAASQSPLVSVFRVSSSVPHIFWYWWRLWSLGSRAPCVLPRWLNLPMQGFHRLVPVTLLQSRHRSVEANAFCRLSPLMIVVVVTCSSSLDTPREEVFFLD